MGSGDNIGYRGKRLRPARCQPDRAYARWRTPLCWLARPLTSPVPGECQPHETRDWNLCHRACPARVDTSYRKK